MTLREVFTAIGEKWTSAGTWFDDYYIAITTKNILDWEMGQLALTGLGVLFAMWPISIIIGDIKEARAEKRCEAAKALKRAQSDNQPD